MCNEESRKLKLYQMAVKIIQNIDAVITSGYGNRKNPFTGKPEFHRGIDIAVINNPINEPVYCCKNGTITHIDTTRVYDKVTKKGSFGMVVYVQTEDKWYGVYPHMESIISTLKVGQKVSEGQQLGIMGSTGYSKGRHVHYEERDNMSGKSNSRDPIDQSNLYK
jgi:murein DD-endopeptidase MepM/ murein hydrolase activator NlpD